MPRLLLLLLCQLVINDITPFVASMFPKFSFMMEDFANNSFIDLNRLGEHSNVALQCVTDETECCSTTDGVERGDWYYPDDARVPRGAESGRGVFLIRSHQRVELRRQFNATEPSGIYRCDIATTATVSSGLNGSTIYIGIYGNGGGAIDDVQLSFVQNTLICTSSGGPATNITWTRDSAPLTGETTTVLNDPVNAVYIHTLELPTGVRNGEYSCTVSNGKPSSASQNLTIDIDCGQPPELVSGTVSDLTSTTLNSVVTYECNEGYDIGTNVSRTCLKSEVWSEEEIVCKAVQNTGSSTCEGSSCWLSTVITTVTVVTVIAVLLVAVVILLIIVFRIRRRSKMALSVRSPAMESIYAKTDFQFPDVPEPVQFPDVPEPVQFPDVPEQPVNEIEIELREKNMLFPKSQIELGRVIGQGESGLVYFGHIQRGLVKDDVAIKTGKALSSRRDREKLMKEVSIMINFHHPNVMSLVGLSFDGETPLLIMPFMSKGNVLSYIRGNRDSLYILESENTTEVEAARKACLGICHQISKGMSYLATVKYVHRDLAARNCMIDDNGIIKVSDFGLTEDMYSTDYFRQDDETGREEKLPVKWMAPESVETHVFDEKTDVWSFGVTCWEVFTSGGVPYTGIPVTTLLSELRSGHRLDRPSNIACSDDIWTVVTSCWTASPKDRPTFSELVNTLRDLLDSDPNYLTLTCLNSHT